MHDQNVDEDDIEMDEASGRCFEFECPDCNAHNPYADGFGEGSEILCSYCGTMFLVQQKGGRLKLKEV